MFKRQIAFIENFERNTVQTQFAEAIAAHKDILINYIVEEQLYKRGIDGDGNKIVNALAKSRTYSRITIKRKEAKNQPTDRITLRDTGRFHLSIDIRIEQEGFVVTSNNVEYSKYLLGYYGRNILKVSKPNMKEFIDKFIIPQIRNNVR